MAEIITPKHSTNNARVYICMCRYNLSTPVREILGRHFRFEDDLRTQYATVEDLLAHKMAIPANSRMRFNSALSRKTIAE